MHHFIPIWTGYTKKNIPYFLHQYMYVRDSPSPGGGGGLYSHFFFIHRLGPSIYRSRKKISVISSTPKNIWNFTNPKIYPPFCTMTLRKEHKMHRNDPKYSPILWWPPPPPQKKKYPQNLHTPKNIHFFWKTPKILKFKILNPKKWPELMYEWKYQESTPPPPPPLGAHHNDWVKP